jgi:hypothetical protein
MTDQAAASMPEPLTRDQRVFLVAGLAVAVAMVFAVLWILFE